MKIELNTKELKTILKQCTDVAATNTYSKSLPISIDASQKYIYAQVDCGQIAFYPKQFDIVGEDGSAMYSCDLAMLSKVTPSAKTVVLEWTSEKSELVITSGSFKAKLNIAAARPRSHKIPQFDATEIPGEYLEAINTYTTIPFSYYKANKDLYPISIKMETGSIVAQADDGFSLARVSITHPESITGLDVKIPKLFLDIAADNSSGVATIACTGAKIWLGTTGAKIIAAGINTATNDFHTVFSKVSKSWLCSYTFEPKSTLTSMKPLVGMLSSKEKAGTYITLKSMENKLSMHMLQKDMGEMMLGELDGVTGIVNEKHVRSVQVHLHPQAFWDYTNLLKGLKEVSCMFNDQAIYYKASINDNITVEYMFPTVRI